MKFDHLNEQLNKCLIIACKPELHRPWEPPGKHFRRPYSVHCAFCKLSTRGGEWTEEKAIEHWNTQIVKAEKKKGDDE